MKKIDLSCLIGQQVLCEFGDESDIDRLGFLTKIVKLNDGLAYVRCNDDYAFHECKILEGHWMANPKGELVLPDGLIAETIKNDGVKYLPLETKGDYFYNPRTERTEYLVSLSYFVKVIGPAPGWEW